MKSAILGFLFVAASLWSDNAPDIALKKLMEGNERFVKHQPNHPNQDLLRRETITEKQEPFAVVVCCSDSRVAPEIIFDRGLGDTFVLRVAGNVIGELGLESVRFGADTLNAPLIMVLGHQNCGAVKAVLEGGDSIRDIKAIAKKIEPVIQEAKKMSGDQLMHAVELNAKAIKDRLVKDPLLSKFIKDGKLKIVAAYYDFETGRVSLLD